MKRWPLLLVCAALACSDATAPDALVAPCTDYCFGLDLRIDSTRVRMPGAQTVLFSGDTALVTVFLTNTGSVAPDSNTWVVVSSPINRFSGFEHVPLIAPGKSAAVQIKLGLPLFARTERTVDSLVASVYRAGDDVPHGYEFINEKMGPAFPLQPTTMQWRNVPSVLKYPSTQTVQLFVTNPSPRAIPGDTLEVCIWDVDYCLISGMESVYLPAIAAGQTYELEVPLQVNRSTSRIWFFDEWTDVSLRACYDTNGPNWTCRSVPVDVQPDYEGFCSVKRAVPGVPLSGSTIGSGCGTDFLTNRMDVVSIDANAGQILQPVVTGASVQLYTSTGKQVRAQYSGGAAQFSIPSTGRYYFVVQGSGAYQLRVDVVP